MTECDGCQKGENVIALKHNVLVGVFSGLLEAQPGLRLSPFISSSVACFSDIREMNPSLSRIAVT